MEKREMKILIQGAMDAELDYLCSLLEKAPRVTVGGFSFWEGTIAGVPVVLSKTGIGTALAGAATALGIERFKPTLVINQGTAGAYDKNLTYGDIVLGSTYFNGNAIYSKKEGGTCYIDLTSLEAESEFSKMFKDKPRYFVSDSAALEAAKSAATKYTEGKVVEGTIASFDQWNTNLARIEEIVKTTGATCEEMETAAAGMVAGAAGVPYLAFRVMSNNNTTGTPFQGATCVSCQKFVELVVEELGKK